MNEKVCLIDHDLTSQVYLRDYLEKEGYQVISLNSGYQLKPYLSSKLFHLIILNIESPGGREKGLLTQIQKSHPSRILLIVSEREDPFLKEAVDLGIYGFIHKPFDLQEVYTMVHHLTR